MSDSLAALPRTPLGPAKLLTLGFEGYYMCRLATDPDPTDESRGMSGYTMAFSTEDPLDRIIRFQVPVEKDSERSFRERNFRPPMGDMDIDIGVKVTSVAFDGEPLNEHPLLGGPVRLCGRDEPADGPTFESRNNLTGSDDTFGFVIYPFHLRIESPCGSIKIDARDHVDPAHPERPIWEVLDPAIYGRRLPHSTSSNSPEVGQALGVFDLYAYFRDRRRYLQEQIRLQECALSRATEPSEPLEIQTRIEQFRSRLYQLEFWGDRVISKLGNKVDWAFEINDPQKVIDNEGKLGGDADESQPWPIRFWFGGWDGDLLIGYFRGSLGIPFAPMQA